MPGDGIPPKARLRGGRKTWAKGLRSEVYGDLGVFLLGYAMATAVVYVWTFFTAGPARGILRGALVGIPVGFSTVAPGVSSPGFSQAVSCSSSSTTRPWS